MGVLDGIMSALPGAAASADSGSGNSYTDAIDLNARAGQLDMLGAGMSAASHVQFGIQARQAAQFQAAQYQQNANSAAASSQRTAFDVNRQTQFVTSRALAVAAGSGGGASDPTVVNLIARDAGQGAYESAAALYGGADRARLDTEQAGAKEFEGKNTELNSFEVGAAGYVGGATNLLRSQARGASLMQRFGGSGPQVGGFGSSGGTGVGGAGWGSDITGGGS